MLATALSAPSNVFQAPCGTPPTAAAPAGPAASDGPDSFARLLDAADNAQRSADDEAPGDTPPTTPSAGAMGKRNAAAARGCTRPCGDAGSQGPVIGVPRRDEMPQDIPAATDARARGPTDDDAAGADASALLAGLAALARPLATPTSAPGDAAGRGAPSQGLEGGRTSSSSASDLRRSAGARGNPMGLPALAGTAPGAERMVAGDASGAAAAATPFASLLATAAAAQAARGAAGETTQAAAESLAAGSEAVNNAATPLPLPGLASPAAPTLGTGASSPAEARLPASPGSPDFAHQLGAQLTTFVREGVQHARLELHPLELGPVLVQIQLEGGNAQLSFAAEHAQTRQALEEALPALAASLREAGLTLSGGGVFEQPRQPQQGGGQAAGARPSGTPAQGGSEGAALATPAATPPRRRGVVDLVA